MAMQTWYALFYTVFQKNEAPQLLTLSNLNRFLKILSLTDSAGNLLYSTM